jgi:hypothetical protein
MKYIRNEIIPGGNYTLETKLYTYKSINKD